MRCNKNGQTDLVYHAAEFAKITGDDDSLEMDVHEKKTGAFNVIRSYVDLISLELTIHIHFM